MELTDLYRTEYSTTEYTFFSRAHKTFYRVDYILGYKTNLSIFNVVSEYKAMQLAINSQKKIRKLKNMRTLTQS